MTPVVSVIIPTHDRASLLGQAVESVLGQTLTDLEVIVVDDGSTDATPEVMAAYAGDRRVRYERLARRRGRAAARNRGVQLANATLLGFLDSDDRYLPEALAAHWQAHAATRHIGMTLGRFEHIGPGGEPLDVPAPDPTPDPNRLEHWLFNCLGRTGSVVLVRTWFEAAGGFDERLDLAEDWDLFLRLAHAGCPMRWIPPVVFQYRQHAGCSIHDLERHRRGSLRALEKLFGAPGLRADIAALEQPATAWVNVCFARKHYAAGRDREGAAALARALALDARLCGPTKMQLLEVVMASAPPVDVASRRSWAARLPGALSVSDRELRRAASRVAMGRFFRVCSSATPEAARALWAGMRLDPRWLANRGVLAFLLRYAISAARTVASAPPPRGPRPPRHDG